MLVDRCDEGSGEEFGLWFGCGCHVVGWLVGWLCGRPLAAGSTCAKASVDPPGSCQNKFWRTRGVVVLITDR